MRGSSRAGAEAGADDSKPRCRSRAVTALAPDATPAYIVDAGRQTATKENLAHRRTYSIDERTEDFCPSLLQ